MKIVKLFSFVFFLAIFFANCGSIDVDSDTVINADGTCVRTMSVSGDSLIYKRISYPVKFDASWKIVEKIEEDTSDHKKIFHYTLTKKYEKVNDLNKDFFSEADTFVKRKVLFNKKFRWFYTSYEYSETYQKLNNLSFLPASYYLSAEDMETLKDKGEAITNDSSKNPYYHAISDKIAIWLNRSAFEYQFVALSNFLHKENKYRIDLNKLANDKESLFAEAPTAWMDGKNSVLSKVFKEIIPEERFDEIWEKKNSEEMWKKYKKWHNHIIQFSCENYNNSVTMPGKISETNSKKIKGSTVKWDIKYLNFYFSDYEMKVESRVKNTWSIFVSIALAIMLVVGVFFYKRRKK